METKEFKYFVYFTGERAAGLNPFEETVTVKLDGGIPVESVADFNDMMKQTLAEWYDGARTMTMQELEASGLCDPPEQIS